MFAAKTQLLNGGGTIDGRQVWMRMEDDGELDRGDGEDGEDGGQVDRWSFVGRFVV